MKQQQKQWSLPLTVLDIATSLIFLACIACPCHAGDYPFFEDTEVEKFTHMIIHNDTAKIYIGAVNKIYQLSRVLEEEAVAIMGPQDDSPMCDVTRVCPNTPKQPTDYYNKALMVDYSQSKLIACGSLFQGTCTVHDLNDVANFESPTSKSVVANNATASTVAFIAPGPNKLTRKHVLYVGVSYTGNGPYNLYVPSVSSRSLDPSNMFAIAHTDVIPGTKIAVNSLSREIYPVTYVYGFSNKGFSYFVTVQKMLLYPPKPFLSKLVRVCQQDLQYFSYTEVPLVCRTAPDGTDYNLVQAAFVGKLGSQLAISLGISAESRALFAVFAKSDDEAGVFNKPSSNSALCVYDLSVIHKTFTQNIQHCFNGCGDRGLDFITPTQKCYSTHLKIDDDFCGMDINTPLGGNMPVEAAPVLQFTGTVLTAVAATSIHESTVVFLGTSSGHLKKALVETATNASEYTDIVIDEGSPVNADMVFDKSKNHLYVMTERRVTMVKVQECHAFQSCRDCLGAKDPYCGWCSLENKCSIREACAQAAEVPTYWLSNKSDKCSIITKVRPSQIQITTTRMLSLDIDNLSTLDSERFCVFTAFGKTLITNATRFFDEVQCPTPHTDILPQIPPGEHHYIATLSVRNKFGPDFAPAYFTFYDCSTYTSCTQCASSVFPCDWCVSGHRCTHKTRQYCRNDVIVTGVSSILPSIRSGSGFCPRINKTTVGSTEILVPYGVSRRVSVKVDNLLYQIVITRFVCQFIFEERVRQVHAQLIGQTVYCDEMLFSYSTEAPNITATFSIIWEGNKSLDNPENVHVVIYKCSEMAQSCGTCLELPKKYGCGWCQNTNTSCQIYEHCSKLPNLWLERKQTCPNPHKNQRITSISPTKGPKSGGTLLKIWGFHMNEGSKAEAYVGALPCNITRRYSNKILCTTPASKGTTRGTVKVKFDGEIQVFEDYEFVYVEDPTITLVESDSIEHNDIPKGIPSGGISVDVRGTNLNAIQFPYIYVIVDKEEYNSNCVIQSPNYIKCKSPRVPAEKLHFSSDGTETHPIELEYGFKMDHVKQVQNLSSQARFSKFLMYPDPFYYPFSDEGGIKYYNSDYLTINGRNLNTAKEVTDVTVRIGTSYCNLTSLSHSQLTCRPPARNDGKLDANEIPEVVVEVGNHFKFSIGRLCYELPSSQDSTFR